MVSAPLRLQIAAVGDISGYSEEAAAAVRRGSMRAAQRMRVRGKLAFRADVRSAGLGERLANTWRDEVYPKGRTQSWHPTVFLFSKAPQIIRAHTDGATIKHKAGLMLAIPTENVPNKGRRKATPLEVEGLFNQDLIIRRSKKNSKVSLAFVHAVMGRSGKWRRRTKRRAAQGLQDKLILMFVLVRQVTLRRKLAWPKLTEQLAPDWSRYLGQEVARELAAI